MNRHYKLGSCASSIDMGIKSVKKRLILNSLEEAEAIERGIALIAKDLGSTILLPSHSSLIQHAVEGKVLQIYEYEQIKIVPWLHHSWITSQQLYELGLLVLEQQSLLLPHNLTFVDARPSNYSLFGTHSLVDLGSIKPRTKQNIYSFEADFANHFITPLLLEKKLSIPVSQYFKSRLQDYNIDTSRIVSTLKSRSFTLANWSRSLYSIVSNRISNSSPQFIEYLLSLQSSSISVAASAAIRRTKKIAKMLDFSKPSSGFLSSWNQYNKFHDDVYSQRKRNVIDAFLSSLEESSAIDLGSNTGTVDSSGIIGFVDKDLAVCNQLRRTVALNQAVICTDIAQELLEISNGSQDSCLNLSSHANTAIAMSLIHHIIIDSGLSAECFYLSLSKLFNKVLLEFIIEDDPMIRFLKNKKRENFCWSWNQHLQICASMFSVSSPIELSPTRFAVVLTKLDQQGDIH